ncbi:response regulator [uncultured Phenylobacterium sp.]|uniref:response regulator n=1 Tax=uncultured Phenylobacterium sp. TaxID=349273 RepID=UPI0025D1AF2D|nr:response regulator [uncultured Phenylobacterium sp.]
MALDFGMRVLVIDDYKTMVRIIRSLLQQLGFQNIDDACDGPTALQMIRSHDYGLILSDWNMSPMTGYDLLTTVRSEAASAKIPFVMVTAEAKTENVVAARKAGANNYIIKPFTLAVLKQKLTTVFGEF